jgi:Helix-turn-helix family
VVTRMRYQLVASALPRVLGEQLSGSTEVARAATLLRGVAESTPNADGRPLYAGHAELPWPDTPSSHFGMRSRCYVNTAATAISPRW